jgi:hypothetical protein
MKAIPSETSIREFLAAVASAEGLHGAVSTAAVSGGLGVSLLAMVAAFPKTRSDSADDRTELIKVATALSDVQELIFEGSPYGAPPASPMFALTDDDVQRFGEPGHGDHGPEHLAPSRRVMVADFSSSAWLAADVVSGSSYRGRSAAFGDGCCSAQVRSLSSAGQRDWPHSVRRYSTFGGTSACTMRVTMASPSSWRSCWVSIFCEMPGIARSRSEKRSVLPPKRRKRMTSFHRPSNLRMACSIPAAADAGVCARLLTGASLTFACALAASAGPGM